MTNLIERLRETASKGVSVWGDLQMEAADTIEALFNRNRQLVVESSKYCAEVSRGMSDTIRLIEERDTLRAEVSKLDVLLEECKMDWSGDVTQLKAEHKCEVDTLRQQLAEAQKDAERYRFLISDASDSNGGTPEQSLLVDEVWQRVLDCGNNYTKDAVDFAIDAAMKGTA